VAFSAEATVLADTSAAVAVALPDHVHHAAARARLDPEVAGLAGHAAFEAYSVLTRLPNPNRLTPAAARALLGRRFVADRFLDSDASAALLASLPDLGIVGGAVYDALVASTALHSDLPLVTCDVRAVETYRRLGAAFEVLRS
jgi:predicted nucleic acid-binding protein